jgi:hypothetical protein
VGGGLEPKATKGRRVMQYMYLTFNLPSMVATVHIFREEEGDGTKGVGPGPTLAWPGWKQPDIPVEVDTDTDLLETSCSEAGVLKKLSLAGIAKLSRLKYR